MMGKMIYRISVLLIASLLIMACGGDKAAQKPASDSTTAAKSQPAESTPVPAAAKAGFQKIGDMLNAWSALYKQNEKVLNAYEGMPIMELVTPPLTFVATVQYDLLNVGNKDGRFEGALALAGFKGFIERAGSKLTFGYDRKLEKDGFGPMAKAGDHEVQSGSLDLDQKVYRSEVYVDRAEKRISHDYVEFKMLADGSMICLVFRGQTINARGDEDTSDSVIYVHNGKDQYDFVVGKGKTGPGFKTISFADQGDWTKEKALEGLKAAGYAIETSGGIKGGKLVVDK
jgi:hypothetical protein